MNDDNQYHYILDLIPNESNADISKCGLYRYSLHRVFNTFNNSRVCFIMLNPSTADDTQNDPTVRRCIDYAKRWNYGGLLVLNIFAYRSTDPANLLEVDDPVGPRNEEVFKTLIPKVDKVVCAWGNHGLITVKIEAPFLADEVPQGELAMRWIRNSGKDASALRITKAGQPAHPLYLPKHLTPFKLYHNKQVIKND